MGFVILWKFYPNFHGWLWTEVQIPIKVYSFSKGLSLCVFYFCADSLDMVFKTHFDVFNNG